MLSVRELTEDDIDQVIGYWFGAGEDFLRSMGADPAKLGSREDWREMLRKQISQSYREKASYGIILLQDGQAAGHCNVNKISFGDEAHMHLHIWNIDNRQKGIGTELVRQALPLFFRNLKLKNIVCEPWSLNPAPNAALPKLGFELTRTYTTTPGWINFEQEVNRWELSRERYNQLYPGVLS